MYNLASSKGVHAEDGLLKTDAAQLHKLSLLNTRWLSWLIVLDKSDGEISFSILLIQVTSADFYAKYDIYFRYSLFNRSFTKFIFIDNFNGHMPSF